MWKYILAIQLIVPIAVAHADVLYVQGDGSIRKVYGTITHEDPGKMVGIRTADGKELEFRASDVLTILRNSEDTSPSLDTPAFHPSFATEGHKSPTTALVLSVLIPGAGQFYNGQPGKGVVQLVGAVGGLALGIANMPTEVNVGFASVKTGNAGLSAAGFGVALAACVWSIVDAPTSASKINHQLGLATLRDGQDLGVAYRVTF